MKDEKVSKESMIKESKGRKGKTEIVVPEPKVDPKQPEVEPRVVITNYTKSTEMSKDGQGGLTEAEISKDGQGGLTEAEKSKELELKKLDGKKLDKKESKFKPEKVHRDKT